MNSEEFIKFQAEQQLFAAQHVELYMCHFKRDSCAGARAYDEEKDNAIALRPTIDRQLPRGHWTSTPLPRWYAFNLVNLVPI